MNMAAETPFDLPFDIIESTGRICKRPNFGWLLETLDEIDSTNKYAKESADELGKPSLILAKHQTAGLGRGTRTWEDEGAGNAVLSTWSMRTKTPPQPYWTLGIGLYLYESLSEAFKS